MSSQSVRFWFTLFLRARLGRVIALFVFLSILAVEAVILIPSTFNYKRDQLAMVDEKGRSAAVAALAAVGHGMPVAALRMVMGSSVLRGAVVFAADGTELGRFGEAVGLAPPGAVAPDVRAPDQVSALRAETVWRLAARGSDLIVAARLDAADVMPAVWRFVVRIIGLVLVISVVVTAATLVVMTITVLKPLLELHRKLSKAAADPTHPERYHMSSGRRDELGEVMGAFNRLITQVATNMGVMEQAQRELAIANDHLEHKVAERTGALLKVNARLRGEVSARRHAERRLFREAYHDLTTTLPNGALFTHRLRRAQRRLPDYQVESRSFVVLSLSVDRFKRLTDGLGPRAGEMVLQAVALRLRGVMRPQDSLARVSSDGFGVLMEDVAGEAAALAQAEAFRAALMRPIEVMGERLHVSLSVGIAVAGPQLSRVDEMLQAADLALTRAHRRGAGAIELYRDGERSSAAALLRLEGDLRQALEDGGQFDLYYQPLVDLQRAVTVGFEALLRWNHPERGLVLPDDFIALAEETGLIRPLGAWALDRAAAQLADWRRRFAQPYFVSVNVSGNQIYSDRLIDDVTRALAESGLPGSALKLEVTETVLMDDPGAVEQLMRRLKRAGVRLGIDDFGTGYSSLAYLQRLPFDMLKIDRAFIRGMSARSENRQIVKAISDLGRTLGLELVAEGVETDADAAELRALGCDLAQGFLFARPLPAAEVERQLAMPVARAGTAG